MPYLPCLAEDRDPYSLQRDRSGNRIWVWEGKDPVSRGTRKRDRTLYRRTYGQDQDQV